MKKMIVTAAFLGIAALALAQSPASTSGSAGGNASAQGAMTGANVRGGASAQANQNPPATASANAGMAVEAELTKGLDAKKAKVGDPVMAKCTNEAKGKGDFRIPKNAKLIGHVTEVQARGKGQSQSTLGIAFDKALLKDGREIPFPATIQAIAAPPSMAMEADNNAGANDSMSSGNTGNQPGAGPLTGANSTVRSTTAGAAGAAGNLGGNVASTAGSVAAQTNSAAGGPLGGTANTSLTAGSSGVIGLKGLQLDAGAANATQGSVIRSSSDNVRLESGTRLVLRLTAQ